MAGCAAGHIHAPAIEGFEQAAGGPTGEADWVRYRIQFRGTAARLEAIGRAVHDGGGVVRELRAERLDLEAIYHQLVALEGDDA